MRHSEKMTTAAVLRAECSVKIDEWSRLLGCSENRINNLETGRSKLDDETAQRMYHETGVSLGWLLGGDPAAPPVTAKGEPFTHEHFERAQVRKIHYDRVDDSWLSWQFLQFAGRLRVILSSANRKKDFYLAAYRVGKFLDSLAADFGENASEAQDQGFFLPLIKADIERRENDPDVLMVRDLLASIAPKAKGAPAKKPSRRSSRSRRKA